MGNLTNKKKIIVASLIIVAVVISIFCTLLFSNSSYAAPEKKVSATLIDKIRGVQKQGGTLELNKDELNEIVTMYFKGKKYFKGVEVKAIGCDIKNDNIIFYVPMQYKGINFLVSSEGKLAYSNNKVEYKPIYFKTGKVILPKAFIINKVKNYLNGTISVGNDSIAIDKSMIPLQIKSIEAKDNKVFMGIVKSANELEEKLKSISGNKTTETTISNAAGGSSTVVSQNNGSSNGTNPSSNSVGPKKNVGEMDAALNRIIAGLNNASGSVNTGGQKAVISSMISAMNSMKGNANANPYDYASGVRAEYNKLSPEEKSQLKVAVFSNINGSDVTIVSNILGK